MGTILKLLKMLNRSNNGPVCSSQEWDTKRVPMMVKDTLKKHGLEKVCDPQNPVNSDLELSDNFYRAGYELALEMGMFCTDTERIIKVDENELAESIKQAPSSFIVGSETEQVVVRARKPESAIKPRFIAMLAIVMDEDLWIPLVEATVRNSNIDICEGPSLNTVYGYPVRGGSPFETIAGIVESRYRNEAYWRAGRAGMATVGVSSSTTEYGHFGGFANVPKPNISVCLAPAELKTSYSTFHKIALALGYGSRVRSASHSMIGGYSGPPEGAVITNIASDLLQFAIHQADLSGSYIFDIRYNGNCGRHNIWASSVACQAVARNTTLPLCKIVNQVSGPCTDMILYESTVGLATMAVSGAASSIGPRSAGGRYQNHMTPLETHFCAEVFKAASAMKLVELNELVNKILPLYEGKLSNPPIGKSIYDCYDLQTMLPTAEWIEIYEQVKKELQDYGLTL